MPDGRSFVTESGTVSGSTIYGKYYAFQCSREMSSEIAAYHGWPWWVSTDFGENNIAMFVVWLLLRGLSTAFLTHDNAF